MSQSSTQSLQTCPRCGHSYPSSESECPSCRRRHARTVWSRERILFSSLLILILLTIFTSFISRAFHAKERDLAGQWLDLGEQQLNRGDTQAAVNSFRTSLSYEPFNAGCQLRLARALVALGRSNEARNYLANLLAQDPGNGEANLEMARLARADGSLSDANRYFHNAIYGVWPGDAQNQRLDAWLELCQFLLSHNTGAEAQAELLALAANAPDDDQALQLRLGRLFLQTNDPQRALREFQLADRGSKSPPAAAGSGIASFELGDYSEAARALKLALRLGDQDPEISARLVTINQVLAANPMEPGIHPSEQFERARKAFGAASARLNQCDGILAGTISSSAGQTSSHLPSLPSRMKDMQNTVEDLPRHPESIPAVMELVFEVEKAAALACGAPSGADQILLLLSRTHSGILR